MISKLKAILNKIKTNLYWVGKLWLPFGKKVYFIASPSHINLGDNAIAFAEELFLKKCGFSKNRIKTFTQNEFRVNIGYAKRYIKTKYLICGIGGGNIGNQWYPEELFRYSFLDLFPDNPTIIFPQSVFFTDDEAGKKAVIDSLSHYENHKNLILVAREQKSFEILNQLYHTPKILLTPDIVLSTEISDYGITHCSRSGVLLVFRSDEEIAMSQSDREKVKQYLVDHSWFYRETDMYSNLPITKNNRDKLVKEKFEEFIKSELVITDRLHGMIFAAITGTPCIVFGNYNHKVKGTYDWISYLSYIKYVNNASEALHWISVLLKMNNCHFDTEPINSCFSSLIKEIKSYAN